MKRRTALYVAASAVLACGLAGGFWVLKLSHPVTDVASVITIDPDVGEVFAPPPPGASPAMTPQQAWDGFTRKAGDEIPSNVRVSLGLLTLPLGPSGPNGSEAYTVKNALTYGFSWHSCPVSMNPKVRKLPRNPCVEWSFVNADTGHQIDNTWQMGPLAVGE